MQAVTHRPLGMLATALVGASIIIAPVLTEHRSGLLRVSDIDLTAGDNLLDDMGVTSLFNHAAYTPVPALQQLLTNWVGYLETAVKDPSSLGSALTSIGDHAKGFLAAPVTPFAPEITPGTNGELPTYTPFPDGVYSSVDTANPLSLGGSGFLSNGLGLLLAKGATPIDPPGGPTLLGTGEWLETLPYINHDSLLADLVGSQSSDPLLAGLLEFTGSPLSGVLWGLVGTLVSPFAATFTDLSDAFSAVDNSAPDYTTALLDLLAVPSSSFTAFFNGTTVPISLLNASGLESLVSLMLGSATGDSLKEFLDGNGVSLGINTPISLGGLFSPGGSLFDALGLNADASMGSGNDLNTLGISLPGTPVGPIGSLIEMTQAMSHGLGWDLSANPLGSIVGPEHVAGAVSADDIFGSQANDMFSMLESELGLVFNDIGLGSIWSDLTTLF